VLERRPAGLQAPAPSFPRLVRIELRKAVDTVTGRWLLVATGVLVLGALALGASFPPPGQPADLQWLLTNALLPVSLLLPVLGVLLLAGEFSTRSLLVTFALVPSRGRVVAAKTVAAVLLAVAGTAVTGVLAVAAAGALDLAGELGSWSVEPAVLLQLVLVQVVYVLVGVGFGLLAQNTPLAVVTYLVVPSLLSPVVLLVPSLREVGSWVDLASGTAPLLMAGVADAGDWARVASVTAIWAGLPAVLGWLRLQRREIA
jgi:ABC-type transport system involved in multi-copper enzyme maturation permease subunit